MMPSQNRETKIPLNMPVLVATASILQISESLVPYPVPGLRFGFANIISLIVLYQYGFKPALTLTLLRTVVSSFILSSFLSPGFILSFSAGLVSISTAGLLNRISSALPIFRISPVGLGIAAAFVHNMVQIILAYLIVIRLPEIFFLVPWLSIGSICLGAFTGWITSSILKELILNNQSLVIPDQTIQPFENNMYVPGNSYFHQCRVEYKLLAMIFVTLVLVLKQDLILYAVVFAITLLLIPAGGLKYARSFRVIKKLWVIILSAFLLPLYFNPGNHVLIETELFILHKEALISGIIFSARIILLAVLTSILAQTTKIDTFTSGIKILIKPFDRFGMNTDYIAQTISDSLRNIPQAWHEIRSVLKYLLKNRKRNFRDLKKIVIQLFVYLFSARNNRA